VATREPAIDPYGYVHLSSRGVYGRTIFHDDGERELFLSLYHRWSLKYGWRTLAWVLMGNHHHFLVKLEDGDLTTGVRVLHSGFSRRMHVKYGETRKGHLVRHCFYAGPLETTDAILKVARYIDLNPVRAGLCDRPDAWPWSSYAASMGRTWRRPFHSVDELLELAGVSPTAGRRAYRAFVHEQHALEDQVFSSDDGYMVESPE
jgi:REP element-mobilizing transposase RayT